MQKFDFKRIAITKLSQIKLNKSLNKKNMWTLEKKTKILKIIIFQSKIHGKAFKENEED